MKTGIIFDMDGTLWDSVDELVISWNELLRTKGYPLVSREDVKNTMGKSTVDFAKSIFPYLQLDEGVILLEECRIVLNAYLAKHGGKLYPHIYETLSALKEKYELYIVSNCHDGYVETFLEYNKMHRFFSDYEYASRTNKDKAENIKILMKRNNIEKAIYVGDTQSDLIAAKEAGVMFIHAAYGFGKINESSAFIGSFDMLPEIIADLLSGEKNI